MHNAPGSSTELICMQSQCRRTCIHNPHHPSGSVVGRRLGCIRNRRSRLRRKSLVRNRFQQQQRKRIRPGDYQELLGEMNRRCNGRHRHPSILLETRRNRKHKYPIGSQDRILSSKLGHKCSGSLRSAKSRWRRKYPCQGRRTRRFLESRGIHQ